MQSDTQRVREKSRIYFSANYESQDVVIDISLFFKIVKYVLYTHTRTSFLRVHVYSRRSTNFWIFIAYYTDTLSIGKSE